MNWRDFRYESADIEAYREMFCYVGEDLKTGEWVVFEISRRRNDLFKMVKHLVDGSSDYLVGYNSISYDSQVLQFIVENHQKWVDLEWFEIVNRIFIFSKRRIDDSNHDLFAPYREEYLWKKQIDLFKVHHFDNKNRRVSLKWLEFSLDLENIEEMPVPFDKYGLTDEEIDVTIKYCINDVKATTKFFYLTVGECEHELYRGKNKIQERLDAIEEYNLPQKAMNWSDVKIGDEINLIGYMDATGLDRKAVEELKKNRKPTRKITFGDCIPDYVEFETKEFKEFYNKVKKEVVRYKDKKQHYLFRHNGTTYKIAKGGIHSMEKKRRIIPKFGEVLKDADVGGQYPNSICKRELYPRHLGPKWLTNFKKMTYSRPEDKAKGKDKSLSEDQRRKYKSRSEFKKLATNGGGFGKTNESGSWQYDPEIHFSVTIGNQFEILMLIEKMEMNGIHVISANTDGILCLYSSLREKVYMDICDWWEKKVGNDVYGKLEFAEYELFVQTSVNMYIAVKKDEKDPKERVKKKGTIFSTEHEINKNKSKKVIALALEQYILNDKPVEESILAHKNIFDFCMGVKGTRDYFYRAHKEGDYKDYFSVVRFYASREGRIIQKIKKEGSLADGAKVSEVLATDKLDGRVWRSTVANHISLDTPLKEYGIDYEFYVRRAKEVIRGIENPRKKPVDPNQISMF